MRRFFIRMRWAKQNVEWIFEKAWMQILARSRQASTLTLQRTLRGFLDRVKASNDIQKLEEMKKIMAVHRTVT